MAANCRHCAQLSACSTDASALPGAWVPPVVLYKVGDVYFVVDGHHRVSVARQQGQEFIEAEVRECKVKVSVGPDLRPEDLEVLGARVDFLERTGLDRWRPAAVVEVTVPDGYVRMLEHIAVHRYFMGLEERRDISDHEAVAHWYDTVYTPVVSVIRARDILREFPGRTEGDLYIWVLDHQHFLHDQGRDLSPPEIAAEQYIQRLGSYSERESSRGIIDKVSEMR